VWREGHARQEGLEGLWQGISEWCPNGRGTPRTMAISGLMNCIRLFIQTPFCIAEGLIGIQRCSLLASYYKATRTFFFHEMLEPHTFAFCFTGQVTVPGLGVCGGFAGAAPCNAFNGGGSCIVVTTGWGLGYCECNPGFSGIYCQTSVPLCGTWADPNR